ncbi:hypothetical protein C2E31_18645 [Rhodopirellula baltica]|nr:hypothetical protein C2E31_18645 [Rhodopirellula baltica]
MVLQGQAGGPQLLEERPDVLNVALSAQSDGTLAPNTTYDYRITYVTSAGSESLASLPTVQLTTSATSKTIVVNNLPTTPSNFVGRRLYRRIPGSPNFEFVTQLDRVTTSYTDSGETRGGMLRSEFRPDGSAVVANTGRGGSLAAGVGYNYRFTFVDAIGGETSASAATTTFAAPDSGALALTGIPVPTEDYVGTRVYRLIPQSNEYELVVELKNGETSYTDDGENETLIQWRLPNNGDNSSLLLPRFDARLSIDPGIVVKLQSARIEASFGADFYAEGVDGKKVIFTSRRDDTYGAGGTFDTNNDKVSGNAQVGDWGGLVFRQDSTGSLDYSEIRYGGGSTSISGGFTDFNAVEILQADVRIANSVITDNADGFASQTIRGGIGFNDQAAIFVRGSQPTLINNIIEGNQGAAISINPDSFVSESKLDAGRSTGAVDTITVDSDNQGPLISGNRLDDNDINGIRVRSEILTGDSVWDDTDIVHVVDGSIVTMTHHYEGTLRLKSDPDQSLVVKFGPGANLVGTGRPLDITDRIGGTLQVIGTPGNPVVMTSWNDSSIGAGFTPDGKPMNATLSQAVAPAAGDWQGIVLDEYVNDRNVAYVLEAETADSASIATNAFAKDAQIIGDLADGQKSGDENERLGFNVRGTLATNDDVDVYSFTATGGTGVYIDIDQTSVGLDSIVELVTANATTVSGNTNVQARSDNSFYEATDSTLIYSSLPAGTVQPLFQLGVGNVESANRYDAGMRVILPGSNNSENTYYVRVRSADGQSSGSYQLGIRLRETEEVAGSTVRLADIRYATNAITLPSAPLHSPLTGTAGESLDYTTVIDPTAQSGDEYIRETQNVLLDYNAANADKLGNLLTSDRGSLVVNGVIGNVSSTDADVRLGDVDVYQVDLFAQQLESDVFDSENRFVTATFDIDYADGLGRPNTSIAVYDQNGTLILHSRDSNVADDRGRPLNGVDQGNLAGGSAGGLDAYIGPVELPEGTYFVAVSSAAAVPADLNQYFTVDTDGQGNAVNDEARLFPINSVRRLIDESFDTIPGSGDTYYSADAPIIPSFQDDTSFVPYSLDDMRLFVNLGTGYSGTNRSGLVSVNPFTGIVERLIGQSASGNSDIAARADGELFQYALPPFNNPNNGNSGGFENISPVNGAATALSDDGIVFRQSNQNGNGTETNDAAQFLARGLAFPLADRGNSADTRRTNLVPNNSDAFVIGARDARGRGGEVPFEFTRNILYGFRQQTGEITSLGSTNADDHRNFPDQTPYRPAQGPASEDIEYGIVDTGFIYNTGGDGGEIQGLAYDPELRDAQLWGVTNNGGIHSFSPYQTISTPANSPLAGYNRVIPTNFHGVVEKVPEHAAISGPGAPNFSGLTFGPRQIDNQGYRQTLFMSTSDGWLYAVTIDSNGGITPANVFYNGRSALQLQYSGGLSTVNSVTGIAFSNLEASPWGLTGDRNLNDGHGVKTPYDQSRTEFASRGGASLYYGFEVNNGNNNAASQANDAGNTLSRPDGNNGELAPGGSHGSIISAPIDLEGYSSGDKPTLYFSYYMQVEDNDDYIPTRQQNDSFRVFAAGDDGEWKLLATNNDFRQLPAADEYDYYDETGIPVQELFDDTNNRWRQARVDLSPMAGNENVRIRFDFSTAGAMQAHFDSLELVAVPGDDVVNGQLAAFLDATGNQIVLENKVGTTVAFPAASDITIGDVIQLVDGNGVNYALQFTNTTPLPGQVQITPGMTANQVARAAIAALSQDVQAKGPLSTLSTDGRVRFASITDFSVFGSTVIGESNPILVQRFDTMFDGAITANAGGIADQIVIPDGQLILSGDQLVFGNTQTIEFVEELTGNPNEFLFSPSETADEIARRLMTVLDSQFDAIYEGDGIITIVANQAVNSVATADSPFDQAAISSVDEGRIEVAFQDAITGIPADIITIDHVGGTSRVQLVNQLSNFPPANLIEVQVGLLDTAADIAAKVQAALPGEAGALVTATGELSVAASSVTISSDIGAMGTGLASARELTVPAGNQIADGEILSIADDNGITTLEFIDSPVAGPAGTVNFQAGDAADVIAARILAALNGNTEAFVVADVVTIFGAFSIDSDNDLTAFNDVAINAAEFNVPRGDQIAVDDTIDVTVGGLTTTFTFVNGTPTDVTQIEFAVTDSSAAIANRVVAALVAFNAVRSDTAFANSGVRLLADSVAFSAFTPTETLAHATILGDVTLIPINSVERLRHGMQFAISANGDFEQFTLIEAGRSIDTNAVLNSNAVYFDRAGLQFTPQQAFNEVVRQINEAMPNTAVYADPNGRGIVIDDDNAFVTVFDNGVVGTQLNTREINESALPLTLPAGNKIVAGEQLTVTLKRDSSQSAGGTIVLTLVPESQATGAAGEILYNPADSAADVTTQVLSQLPLELQAFQDDARKLLLLGVRSVKTSSTSKIISYAPANTGTAPIIVDSTMTIREVASRLQTAVSEGVAPFITANSNQSSTRFHSTYGGDRIRLYNLTPASSAGYGLSQYEVLNYGNGELTTSPVPADEFGVGRPASYAGSQQSTAAADNNDNIEGVYIDDIVVGFAERGEMVVQGSNRTAFSLNPETLPDSHPQAVQPERQNETLLGPYSLEIRTSDEYGVPQDYDPINLELDEYLGLGRSFDTNDRLTSGTVSLITQPGTTLRDGNTFVLDDGWRRLTFEFDSIRDGNVTQGNVRVSFDPSSPDAALTARAVRNAINSAQVQNVLSITAATSDSFQSAANTANRVELFGSSSITVNPTGGRFIKQDLVKAETSQGRETSRETTIISQEDEIVQRVQFGDELARSTPTGFVNGDADTYVGIGKIGDFVNTGTVFQDGAAVLPADPAFDYDSVRIYLSQGQTVDIDVDTLGFARGAEKLDLPYISVFEAGEVSSETLFHFEIDRQRQSSLFEPSRAPGESEDGAFLAFTAPKDGFYDVVVSSTSFMGSEYLFLQEAFRNFYAGGMIEITSGVSQVRYEYTNGGPVTPGNVAIDLSDASQTVAELTAAAIAANQASVVKANADGQYVNLFNYGNTYGVGPTMTVNTNAGGTFSFPLFAALQFRDSDFGEYALNIRPADDPTSVGDDDVIMVDYQFGISDANRVEDQGQIVISSNFIQDSSGTGINAVSNTRGSRLVVSGNTITPDALPEPGSARLLRNQNTDSLIPGVVISNNVISNSGTSGINFGGDVNVNGQIPSPTSFGRIVNNTVVNEGNADGIRISGNASPTVLNNIVSGFTNGIVTTANQAGEVVVGGNAFQGNNNNSSIPLATSSIVVPGGVQLFQDAGRRIYIPAAGSEVIDSSFASLPDRSEFFQTVKDPVGIAPSPIIAPEYDAYGQPRVDDPLVNTPAGVGQNVFIDRGAIDRADDVRPTAVLTGPQDAIGIQIPGGDQDQDGSFVRLTEGTLTYFEVQLLDPAGTGIDPATVNENTVILTENGIRLIPDRDYVFGYSSNSNTIRLTPLTGIWRPDAVYEITLNNSLRLEVALPSGDQIPDGSQVIITENGGAVTTFEYESGYSLVIPQTTLLTVDGTNAQFTDGQQIVITNATGVTRTLEFNTNAAATPSTIPIDIRTAGTVGQVRDAILAALLSTDPGSNPAVTVAQALGLNPTAIGNDQVQLGTTGGHVITTTATAMEISGVDQGVQSGDTFTYSDGSTSVTFELTTTSVSDPNNVEVLISPTDSPDEIAAAIAAAVSAQNLGLGSAQAVGGGRVALGGSVGDVATVNSSAMALEGSPGIAAGAIAIPYRQTAGYTSSLAAADLQAAIREAGLNVETFNPGGGTLLISGASSIQSDIGGVLTDIGTNLPAVSDLAGNRVRETRVNDETRFTIIMPEVRFDFGDAPASFDTLLVDNGARHTVSGTGGARLGVYLDTEENGQPVNRDDALLDVSITQVGSLFSIGQNSVSVVGSVSGGEELTVTIGSQVVTYQLIRATENPTGANVPITFVDGESAESIAQKVFEEIRASFDVIGSAVLMELSGDTVNLQPVDDEDGVPIGTLVVGNVPYLVFTDDPNVTGNVIPDSVIGFLNPLDPSGSTIPINVTGSGLVDIWVDFDGSGEFEADEQIIFSEPVTQELNPNPLIVAQSSFPIDAVPQGHVQGQPLPDRWMRVRLSQSGDLSPTGVAVGGEVEDYMISVAPYDPPQPVDDPVNPANGTPYVVVEDGTLTVDTSTATPAPITDNDLGLNQLLPVRYFVGQQPQHGRLVINPGDELTGSFTYIPDSDFVGIDTFTYRLTTQRNSGSEAVNATFGTVTIEVTPVNDIPGVVDHALVATEYQPNESPADTPTVFMASDLIAGATGDGNAMIPGLPFDESNQDSSLRLLAITAGGVTIDASNQTAVAITPEGGRLTAEFATDFADPLDPTTFDRTYISRVYYQGADYFNSDNLRAATDPPILDSFVFTIGDDGRSLDADGNIVAGTPLSASATATVRVTPQNSTPTPGTDLVSIADPDYVDYYNGLGQAVVTPMEDTSIIIPSAFLLQNDLQGSPAAEDENEGINSNDGQLTITSVSVDPFYGTVELDATTGDIIFTPADDIYGQVLFSYEIEDRGQDEAVDGTRANAFRRATVTSTIFVEPVNDVPVAYDRALSVDEAIEPAGPAILSFTANDLINGRGVTTNSPVATTSSRFVVVAGSAMIDGETFILTNSAGVRRVLEFSTTDVPSVGTDVLVTYLTTDTADEVALKLGNALVAAGLGGVVDAATVTMPLVTAVSTRSYTAASSASASGISVPDGSMIVGGEVIRITDGQGQVTTLELSTSGVSATGADLLVTFTPTDTAATIATAIKTALIGAGIGAYDDPAPATDRAGVLLNSPTVTGINEPSSLIVSSGNRLSLPDGAGLVDGETVTFADGRGGVVVVEFNTTGTAAAGSDLVVQYTATDLATDIATNLVSTLRGNELGVVDNADGSVSLTVIASAVSVAPTSAISASTTAITLPAPEQLIDGETVTLTVDGNPVVVEFNTTGVATVDTNYVVPFALTDTPADLVANLEALLRTDGYAVTAVGDTLQLWDNASTVASELRNVPGLFDKDLPAPYNEAEQTLRVVSFTTAAGTINAMPGFTGSQTLDSDNGGLYTFNFTNGVFVNGTYAPPVDYNQAPPSVPFESFTYSIADNGRTTLPFAGLVRSLPEETSVLEGTVTITVRPANDKPYIEYEQEVEILEDPAPGQSTIDGVFTTVLPAPPTAGDEQLNQGRPTVTSIIATDPRGVMEQLPVVTDEGGLTVYPKADAVGQVVYAITFTDDHPTNPQSTTVTLTVNVRPVNDAPRFNPNVAGTGAVNTLDDAYEVANVVDPNTGLVTDASITYTLREDNSQPVGQADREYFIPLYRDPSVIGYNPVGLLDVFTVGPANEISTTIEGGNQSLMLNNVPVTTDLGGTLRLGTDGLGRQGVFYDPPQDFNNQIGGFDTFTYSVIDNGTTWGNGQLESDPRISTNVVRFDLNPVNDRPVFDINLPPADMNDPTGPLRAIETLEDSSRTLINNFAFNINPGVPTSAFDEVNPVTGQTVRFSLTSLGFPQSQANQFFTEFPTISEEGILTFQPAPDVFGSFDFEIVLSDDGPGNETRGDLISSHPRTITIDVLPINDPPVVDPAADPLEFSINEDGSIDIMTVGTPGNPGLLDVFNVGPINEGEDLTPGGNQTLSIQSPIPTSSTFEGTIEEIRQGGQLVGLRYHPKEDFVGTDTFTYTVTDDGVTVDFGTGGVPKSDPRIATNIVKINVNPVNDIPQFSGPANVTVDEDAGTVSISSWANNVLPGPPSALDELDTQDVFFTINQVSGAQGLFTSAPVAVIDPVTQSASLDFVTAPNANGVGVFEVQLTDVPTDGTTPMSTSFRTFTISVRPVNDPPTFDRPMGPITITEDFGPYSELWATNVSPGPADEADQTVRFEVVTPPDAQSLFQQLPEIGADRYLRFLPAANANGTVDLTVTAIDSAGGVSEAVVLRLIITPVNDRPTAVPDSLTTDEDTILTIPASQLLANDIDPDINNPGDTLTIVFDQPEFLSLSGASVRYDEATQQITYDPSGSDTLQALSGSEQATDSFTYRVVDSTGAISNIVTVALSVSGINDAPVALDDSPTLNPNGPTTIPILSNDSDVDGTLDPSTIEFTLQPAFGSLSVDSSGVITYNAFSTFAQEDVFRYRIRDNDGAFSNEATVRIQANAAPIAREDRAGTYLNEFVDINVVANDEDPDPVAGAPNGGLDFGSLTIVSAPLHGEAIPRGDGTIRYIPSDGFLGIDSFQYTIADSQGRVSSPGTVRVQVTGSRLQNPNLNPDVNDDGDVSPIDALLVINKIARAGTSSIPVTESDSGPPYFDVDGNRTISVLDALLVINELGRRQASGGSGEGESVVDSIVAESTVMNGPMDFLDSIVGTDDDDDDDRLNAIDAAFGDLI